MWVGGIGGCDIVGFGGKGGFYWLDVGYDVYQLFDEEKDVVFDDVKWVVCEMGWCVFKQR